MRLYPIFVCLCSITPAQTLSEDDAVRHALAASASLEAARLSVAGARLSAPMTWRSPELRLAAYDDTHENNLTGFRRFNVGLRWTPPRLGELGLPGAMAVVRSQAVAAEVAADENRLAAEVRLLHRTIRLIDEQIRIAAETVRTDREIVDVLAEQAVAGVGAPLERARADLELASARAAAARLEADRRLQLLRLCLKTDHPCAEPIELMGDDLSDVKLLAGRAYEMRAAAEARGEIAAAVALVRWSELRLSAAGRDRTPWFSYVQITRQTDPSQPVARWGFQVGVDLSLWRWRSRETKEASIALQQARVRERAARRSVNGELEELAARLDAAVRELEGSLQEVESLARRQVDVADAQLAAGLSDRTEPLAARVRLLAARQARVSKLMECHALAIGLDQAAGRAALTAGNR